ncbi:peptidoglycan-binding domain-containing protein, partial [Faucicola atlantae]|uniref:peptidoglycan-binding domain-containing protein n=2 Tax=Moraxellaceae TaxID=468 RepID=UPI000ABFF1F1
IAIREYQRKMGVPADGRAGQKFYRLIMGNAGNVSPTYQPVSSPIQSVNYGNQTGVIHIRQDNQNPSQSPSSSFSISRGSVSQSHSDHISYGGIVYRRIQNPDGTTSLVPANTH